VREVLIYGVIDRWGWEASAAGIDRIVRELAPGEALRLRIHSPGGSPFEASAMRARLESHDGPIEIVVDGLAASAAAQLLATRGADVALSDGSFVMIHNTSALADGDHRDLASALAMLKAVDQQTAELFAKRTGKEPEIIAAMMNAETWMTAQQAVEQGFADRVVGASAPAVGAEQRFELGGYRNVPRQLAEKWTPVEKHVQGDRMDPKVIRQRLKLPETATDAEVFAALDKLQTPETPAPIAAPPVVEQSAIDAAVQRALSARDTQVQASQAHKDACNAAVENFIAAKKIRPADRAAAIAACGDTAQSLAATVAYWTVSPELVPGVVQVTKTNTNGTSLSPQQLKMAAAAGVKPETIQQLIAEENAR
jgi:ATP-dependent protease ClpP protease subunit